MGQESKYLGIGTKIIVMVCALVIVTSCAVGFFTYWRFKQVLVARELKDLGALSQVSTSSFLTAIANVHADAQFLSGTPTEQSIIRARLADGVDPADGSSEETLRARLAAVFESMLRAKPDYVQVRLIGVADGGREIIRVDRSGPEGAIRVVPDSQLERKGDRTFFQEATKTRHGHVYLSDIELNRDFNNNISTPNLPVIRAAVPTYTPQGDVFGIVIINRDLTRLFDELQRNIQPEQSLYIANNRGDYLLHPDPTQTFAFEFGRTHRMQDEFPELQRAASDPNQSTKSVIQQTKANRHLVFGWNRVSFDSDVPGRFVTIALAEPYETIAAEPIRARNLSILVALAVLAPALAIAYALSRRLAIPLQQIARAADAFGQGRIDIELPLDASDEAGVVARSFHEMVNQVRSRTAALQAEITDRTQAEFVGGEQAARISAIVNSVVDAIITIKPDGSIESLNQAAERMFGYKAVELIGRNVKMLMPEPFRGEHDQYLRNYLDTGIRKIIGIGREVFGIRKNGDSFPIDLAVSEVQVGNSRLFTGVVRDMTERKRAEQLALEQSARIHAIVNSVVDAIITIKPDGTVESLNLAAEHMFGYAAHEVIGENIKMLMPDPFRSEHDQYLRNYLETGVAKIIGIGREVIALRKNGTSFPVDLAVNELQLGDRRLFTGVVRDMTERKRTEQLLLEQNVRINTIVNSVIDGIITINPNGTVESLNRAAERMFGYTASEVVGQNVSMLMPEPYNGEHDQYIRNYLETGVPKIIGIGREIVGVRKDGTEFPVDLAVTQVQLQDRRLFTGVVRDISARKQAQAELVQANKELAARAAQIEIFNKRLARSNDELKQFAYVASHDLQEPLRKVTSFCELLRDEYRDRLDGDAVKYIDYAVGGALRMKALVSDLLDYSRVETQGKSLALTPADKALAIAVDNLELTIAESGATVECAPLPIVAADPAQLSRLFQNLVGNAIKYRGDAPPNVNIWAEQRDGEWIFHVQDNGLGIDPQYHARIFVIFQRLHSREAYAGTGIGLAVCKRIAERFGGRIWVESTLGKGSDFCFALPAVEATTDSHSTEGQIDEYESKQLARQAD